MNIDFSPKYQPLFELLECREYVKTDEFKTLSEEGQEYWLSLTKVDTVLLSGGRDSGKTFSLSSWVAVATHDYGHKIMYTRETMSSTDNSITEALNKRIEVLGFDGDFELANSNYKCLNEGTRSKIKSKGKITITGQKTSAGNQTAKLKSIEDYSVFITDEAQETKSYSGWKDIKRSLRAEGLQHLSIIAFNPPTREHWLHDAFWESKGVKEGFNGIKGRIMYIHTSYLDNYEHVEEHNKVEYDGLKDDYDKYHALTNAAKENAPTRLKLNSEEYEHVVMGGFKSKHEGIIYEDWENGEFDIDLPYVYGHDLGFNDPDACVKVAVDHNRKRIYVKEVLFENELGSTELQAKLLDRIGSYDLTIVDSNDARIRKDLRNAGLNIQPARAKDPKRDIKAIQGYTIIVAPDSPNVEKALNNYHWHDKKSQTPHHDWSDLMDAMRYAFAFLTRG